VLVVASSLRRSWSEQVGEELGTLVVGLERVVERELVH
jgi:hypothetical protein